MVTPWGTYIGEAADVQQMKLNENQHGQHPEYVHHPVEDVPVFVVDAVHVDVHPLHLEFGEELSLNTVNIKKALTLTRGGDMDPISLFYSFWLSICSIKLSLRT